MIHLLIFGGLLRRAATLLDLFGQANHLVDRLLAGQFHDELAGQFAELLGRLVGARGREDFHHQRNHHVDPALPDQAQGAVEVEQHVPRRLPGAQFADDFDAGPGQESARAAAGRYRPIVFFVVGRSHSLPMLQCSVANVYTAT